MQANLISYLDLDLNKNLKKHLLNFLKIAITLGGLYLAYGKFDWQQLRESYSQINWTLYLTAFLISIIPLWLNSIRLQVISTQRVPIWELFKINLMSRFFNLFLPTSVGGDIIRTLKYRKYTTSSSKSLSVIFNDRFIGMTTMIFMGAIFYVLPILDKSNLEPWLHYVMIGTFVAVIGIWVFILSDSLSKIAIKIMDLIPIEKVRVKLEKFYDDVREIKRIPKKGFYTAMITSFIGHFINSYTTFLISQSLNLDISLAVFLVTIPVINTLLIAPLSINGIGVRDYLFKNLYEPITTNPGYILLAPLLFLTSLVVSMIGGIVYMLDGDRKER